MGVARPAGYDVLHRLRRLRTWGVTWGATPAEVAMPLPGDDLVPDPGLDVTRAVTIRARPEQVWPWLVQVGAGRAGWYSYDLIDNLGRPSARRVVPELQGLAVGDEIPMTPSGRLALRVHTLEPSHTMVWTGAGPLSWAWRLDPVPGAVDEMGEATRLLTRFRFASRAGPVMRIALLPLEIGDFVMMRKMLLTVRERAEGVVPERPKENPA